MGGNQTLAHYDQHAAAYDTAFAAHDTSDAITRLMAALNRPAPTVLELGCGNGRDLLALQQAGSRAEGVEGAAALARIAASRTGLPIHHFDLLSPQQPPWQGWHFDALYAHHLLFHLPSTTLPWLLWRARDWLVPGGLFYLCDATGDGLEGTMPDGRHMALRRPQTMHRLMRDAGFERVEEWRRPIGAPRRQQGWLAGIWRKIGE